MKGKAMSKVVDLSEQELAELKALTQQTDAAAAIRTAMTEYVRYVRRQRLQALSGQVQMEDNWAELEDTEMKAPDEHPGSGSH
jgi:hypothetical protein